MVTLNIKEIIEGIRLNSDQRDSRYILDAEAVTLIQRSLDYLYMGIVREEEEYFLENTLLRVDDGEENKITLPNFLRIRLVESDQGGYGMYPLVRASIKQVSENGHFDDSAFFSWTDYIYPSVYVLLTDHLLVYPRDIARNWQFRIWYIPNIPKIPESGILDINLPDGSQNFIQYYASAIAGNIEDTENKWMTEARRWFDQIISIVSKRDTTSPLVRSPRISGQRMRIQSGNIF